MKGALIILAVTVLAGIILYILDRKKYPPNTMTGNGDNSKSLDDNRGNEEGAESLNASGNINGAVGSALSWSTTGSPEEGGCCGLHLVCEKELTAIADNKILYYDDEELDRFAGRTPEDYNAEETEEFRDILMTMLPQDVPGWARSLDRRNIRPPQEIRDELLIMLQEVV